jgi:hypothetical protein
MKAFPAFGILLRSRSQVSAVRKLLADNSALPGPRANLELAYSFASSMAVMHLEDWHWDFLMEMARTSESNAPENTAKVFLPVCGLMALGALYGDGLPRARRRAMLPVLRAAASDPRWRVREGAAMALQLIGERDPEALQAIVDGWMPTATLLEKRAVVAGLAHPPLLSDPGFARYCLSIAGTVVDAIPAVSKDERKGDALRVLRQGCGYALSVFAAHAPEEGFALLRRLAASPDPDVAWIVRENLKKNRIAGPFAGDVAKVAAIADAATGRRPPGPARR